MNGVKREFKCEVACLNQTSHNGYEHGGEYAGKGWKIHLRRYRRLTGAVGKRGKKKGTLDKPLVRFVLYRQ